MEEETQQHSDNVDLTALLAADYQYIAQTAFQANEDRARASTFYLLSIGSVLATVFASGDQDIDLQRTAIAFAVVFGALSLLGVFTLMQLARLRASWYSSAQAMNHIKAFALDNADKSFRGYPFPWTNENLPPKYKFRSVAALLVCQVAVISSITFGACIFHIGLATTGLGWLKLAVACGVLWGSMNLLAYRWALADR